MILSYYLITSRAFGCICGPDRVVCDSSYCEVMRCVTSCRRSIVQCEHSRDWLLPQIVVQFGNNGDPMTLKIVQCELVIRYNRYHLFYVLTSLQGCHSVIAMGVSFPTRAVRGRPITKDCAIWPITAVRAHRKEGFRETDSSNCFARVVYESFRSEVKLNLLFEKTKVFFDLACT